MCARSKKMKKKKTTKNKKLLGFLKKHITAIIVLVIGIIVAVTIYIVSQSKKEPIYLVSKSELLAQTLEKESSLKIFWDDIEIRNAVSIQIAFWNNGTMYIDKSDIPSSKPIMIFSDKKIDILSVNKLKTSRETLDFELTIVDNPKYGEVIVCSIKGDEALERFDGAILHILYAGPDDCEFFISGRIKGAPEGFVKKDWSKFCPEPKDKFLGYYFLILGLFIILNLILLIIVRKKKKQRLSAFSIVTIVLGLIFLLFMFLASYKYYFSYLFGPPWL